jgi:DNA-directed RNA polymerase specialized sigma24 family protein
MSREPTITQDKFDKMLAWLDQNREAAGEKYENIRRSLIRICNWRGCSAAEELADEALNVVIQKIDELAGSYSGKPELYFYGVARRLLSEHYRAERRRGSMPELATDEFALQGQRDRIELTDICLTRCIQELKPDDSQLILGYYQGDKQTKIRNRKELAGNLGSNTLRVRVHRIRTKLEECIKRCLEQNWDGMY